MSFVNVAQIRANDAHGGEIITIYLESNLAVSLSNGEDACLPTADSVAEAFGYIETAWGLWASFEWLAQYDEETGKIEAAVSAAVAADVAARVGRSF